MAFAYLKVKSAKMPLFTSVVLGLGFVILILVLVLRIWSLFTSLFCVGCHSKSIKKGLDFSQNCCIHNTVVV